jgi:hypothetical protein
VVRHGQGPHRVGSTILPPRTQQHALAIFIFVVWFWLLITVFADLFRRHDISGWTKAIWVIALIVFSYIAVLAYLIFHATRAGPLLV